LYIITFGKKKGREDVEGDGHSGRYDRMVIQRPLFHYKTNYAIQKYELVVTILSHKLHLTFDMIPQQFYLIKQEILINTMLDF